MSDFLEPTIVNQEGLHLPELTEMSLKEIVVHAKDKLKKFLDIYSTAKNEQQKNLESKIVIAFQILVMNAMSVNVEKYGALYSSRFREQFSPDGELKDARRKLLAGDIDTAVSIVAAFLLSQHRTTP